MVYHPITRPSAAKSPIAVLGLGTMGAQVACDYAIGGHPVTGVPSSLERGCAAIDAALRLAIELGRVAVGDEGEVRARMEVTTSAELSRSGEAPAVIVDCLPEDLDLKAAVIAPLAAQWNDAIIASNTSSLSIATLAGAVGAETRTIGVHYLNPALAFAIVELISAESTAPEVRLAVASLMKSLGRRPIDVKRDVPGFVWNRLQFALLREAIWLAENDVATPEEIDEVVRSGLAPRWTLTGPFATAALGGSATFSRIAANLFPELSCAAEAPSLERLAQLDVEMKDRLRSDRNERLTHMREIQPNGRFDDE